MYSPHGSELLKPRLIVPLFCGGFPAASRVSQTERPGSHISPYYVTPSLSLTSFPSSLLFFSHLWTHWLPRHPSPWPKPAPTSLALSSLWDAGLPGASRASGLCSNASLSEKSSLMVLCEVNPHRSCSVPFTRGYLSP